MDLTIVITIAIALAIVCFLIGRKIGSSNTIESSAVTSNTGVAADEISNELKKKIVDLKTQVAELESRLNQKEEMLKSAMSGDSSNLISSFQDEIVSLNKKIEKLTKELENAKEEREDYESDAESAKKKLKKKSEECSQLSSEKTELTRKMDSLKREFDSQKDKLEDEKNQNQEHKESIEFVNAILNAKEASDEDTKSRNENIDNVFNVLLNYFDSLTYWDLEENCENIPSLAFQWANESKKPWLKDKKVVALIGEFSAGKTSIVNRILSQDNPNSPKLPTNSKATTAIPTYISYGPRFHSQFLDANGKLKNIIKDDFERVKKDVLSKVNVSSLLEYFVISYNNENLKGLTILDTPGFSSNDPEDERRTCDVINEADMLFWVFDVNQAINKSSIEIIKTNIKNLPLFIVMNKCDQLSPNELNEKEDHLRKVLQKENISINEVIRFSEKDSIDELMKAVKRIESKKEKNVIIHVLEDLYDLYDSTNNNYKECQGKLRDKKRNLEATEEKILDYFDLYVEDVSVIGKMPQHESHFFSQDCYEISEDDHEEFIDRCQRILDNLEPLVTEIDKLKQLSADVTKTEIDFAYLKERRKMLQEYEKKIIEAVRKVDPNASIPVHVSSSSLN